MACANMESGEKVDSDEKVQSNPENTGPEPSETGPSGSDCEPLPREIGGRDGPEPTRFGDWEKNGRCIDF